MNRTEIIKTLGLGLEDITRAPDPITIEGQPEIQDEEVFINDIDINELVDEIREDSEQRAALESLIERFSDLRNTLIRVSVESMSVQDLAFANTAIGSTFTATDLPIPSAFARTMLDDPKRIVAVGIESADNIGKRAYKAVIDLLKSVLAKAKELFLQLLDRGEKVKAHAAQLVKELTELVKGNAPVEVTLETSVANAITLDGKIVTDTIATEVKRLLDEAKALCKVPLLSDYISAVEKAVGQANTADELKGEIASLFKEHSSVFNHSEHNKFLGEYVLSKDVRFAIIFSQPDPLSRKAGTKTATFRPSEVVNALRLLAEGKRDWAPQPNELATLSAKQERVVNLIGAKGTNEAFGNPQGSVMLFSHYVQRTVTNYSAMNLQIAKVEKALFTIAKQLKINAER